MDYEELEDLKERYENRIQRAVNGRERERAVKEHLGNVLKLREKEIRGLKVALKLKEAENTRLRKKLVAVSEVLDDLIDSGISAKKAIEDCGFVLIRIADEVNRMD